MIFDFRFLAGVAVGATIGLVISPEGAKRAGIDVQAIKRSIPAIQSPASVPLKPAEWPTNETAKKELFTFSKWDLETFGPKSEIQVTRCISLDEFSIACEMVAHLSWIKEETVIEAVFKRDAEDWQLAAAKTM